FYFASGRRHTRFSRDWSSDVCSSDLGNLLRRHDAHDVYLDAAARIADLEGVRRAAVLTAELRRQGVAPGEVEAALEGSAPPSPRSEERRVGKDRTYT